MYEFLLKFFNKKNKVRKRNFLYHNIIIKNNCLKIQIKSLLFKFKYYNSLIL